MMNEIRELLLNARQRVTVQVNTELLSTYWNVGKIIVEYEQKNKDRADYGKQTLKQLSKELTAEFGKGFSRSNLQNMRAFYLAYPICQTVSGKLSWSHYCELLTISDPDKRSFYEKETINSGWSIRELKRQIFTSKPYPQSASIPVISHISLLQIRKFSFQNPAFAVRY